MKKFSFLLLLFCNFLLTAQVSKSYQNTLNEMILVSGTGEAFISSVQQMKKMFKAQFTNLEDKDWNSIEEYINQESFPNLINQLTPIYHKHLTEEDLKHIIDFYQTDTGKNFAQKAPLIAQESMLIGKKWGMQLGQKIQELSKDQ